MFRNQLDQYLGKQQNVKIPQYDNLWKRKMFETTITASLHICLTGTFGYHGNFPLDFEE